MYNCIMVYVYVYADRVGYIRKIHFNDFLLNLKKNKKLKTEKLKFL